MTREEVLQEIISLPYNNLLLTLPTGFGKTRCAIERIKSFLGIGKDSINSLSFGKYRLA